MLMKRRAEKSEPNNNNNDDNNNNNNSSMLFYYGRDGYDLVISQKRSSIIRNTKYLKIAKHVCRVNKTRGNSQLDEGDDAAGGKPLRHGPPGDLETFSHWPGPHLSTGDPHKNQEFFPAASSMFSHLSFLPRS